MQWSRRLECGVYRWWRPPAWVLAAFAGRAVLWRSDSQRWGTWCRSRWSTASRGQKRRRRWSPSRVWHTAHARAVESCDQALPGLRWHWQAGTTTPQTAASEAGMSHRTPAPPNATVAPATSPTCPAGPRTTSLWSLGHCRASGSGRPCWPAADKEVWPSGGRRRPFGRWWYLSWWWKDSKRLAPGKISKEHLISATHAAFLHFCIWKSDARKGKFTSKNENEISNAYQSKSVFTCYLVLWNTKGDILNNLYEVYYAPNFYLWGNGSSFIYYTVNLCKLLDY